MFCLLNNEGLTQACSSVVITLNNQADIEAFQTTYEPCDSVLTRLELGIYGTSTDITILANLKYVNWFWVIDNHDLTSIDGLESITRDNAGKLVIQDNDELNDISVTTQVEFSRIEKNW